MLVDDDGQSKGTIPDADAVGIDLSLQASRVEIRF